MLGHLERGNLIDIQRHRQIAGCPHPYYRIPLISTKEDEKIAKRNILLADNRRRRRRTRRGRRIIGNIKSSQSLEHTVYNGIS